MTLQIDFLKNGDSRCIRFPVPLQKETSVYTELTTRYTGIWDRHRHCYSLLHRHCIKKSQPFRMKIKKGTGCLCLFSFSVTNVVTRAKITYVSNTNQQIIERWIPRNSTIPHDTAYQFWWHAVCPGIRCKFLSAATSRLRSSNAH